MQNTVMKAAVTFYQNECAKQVYNLIKDRKKRITLLMPTGKLFICLLIADMFSGDNHRTVIVSDKKMIALQAQDVSWDKCENKIESIILS